MIDYRMETFLTLCKTMNYRKAAELLNITQPAVTQHIQYLEEYYGCKLFSYEKRKLSMTAQAEILLHHAYVEHYQEQRLKEELKKKRGHHFSVGTTKTIGAYVIGEQVARFLEEPENHLTVETDNTERILRRLDEGKIDFALIEGYFDKKHFGHKLYKMEPYVGFCSEKHPFAGRSVSVDEILGETILIRETGSGTRSILERMLLAENYALSDFKRAVSIGNPELLEELTAKNSGITFAYRIAGKQHPGLREFHVKEWHIEREFNYVFLPDTDAEQFVEIFERFRHAVPAP